MALRRDVQQQNAVSRAEITRVARLFRDDMHFSYPWLLAELQSRSLDPTKGILAKIEHIPEQAGEYASGYWLSASARFFRFEILIPRAPGVSTEVELWRDDTDRVVVNAHQTGTGKSFGWLALEVLRELNGEQD